MSATDLLQTSDGRTLIDLFTAHGTVWLGHRRQEVYDSISNQLGKIWITGGYATPIVQEMRESMNTFLPEGYLLASLASTGMEANEQALRIARSVTGRNGALGLEGAMHGKSFLTSSLAWDNGDGLSIPDVYRVKCAPQLDETKIYASMEEALSDDSVAAVFIEPIHATSFGWEASVEFYRRVRDLTYRHGVLLIYDEVLTGFYRTGPRFRFLAHQILPDVLVFGKACGNGFPVAGVAIRDDISLSSRMLLGSTFTNNALAAAAVTATLECLNKLNSEKLVQDVERIILKYLGRALQQAGIVMHGSGALWIITLSTPDQASNCASELIQAGVCVGFHNRQLRLMPSLTINPQNLRTACKTIAEVVTKISKRSLGIDSPRI